MILATAIPDRNRVLLVEDDPLQAAVLQDSLVNAGFTVDVVPGGLAAIAKIEAENYDAVLVDYSIPEIDGLALARMVGDLLGPIARPVLIALTAAPHRIAARETEGRSAFDLILDKSCGLLTLIFQVNHLIASAPHPSTRRDIKQSKRRQTEEDQACGPHHPGPEGDDRKSIRILVIEDNELQRSLLTDMLSGRKYEVETASDGLQAIRKIRESCFDLVIADYYVPELDGAAIASLVHDRMSETWRPRLIGFTVSPDLLRSRINAAGPVFDKIVDKSAGVHELLAAVDDLLVSSPNPTTRRLAAASA